MGGFIILMAFFFLEMPAFCQEHWDFTVKQVVSEMGEDGMQLMVHHRLGDGVPTTMVPSIQVGLQVDELGGHGG